jgi:toxin ParE1/3/4
MPTIIKRPYVHTDLVEIWDNIADDSEARADKFIDELDAVFRKLARKPMLGRLRDELAKDMRSFPYGNYLIFFLPLEDGVEIVRVLYGGRDLNAIFHSGETSVD